MSKCCPNASFLLIFCHNDAENRPPQGAVPRPGKSKKADWGSSEGRAPSRDAVRERHTGRPLFKFEITNVPADTFRKIAQKRPLKHENRQTDQFTCKRAHFCEKCSAPTRRAKAWAKMRGFWAGIKCSVGMRGWGSGDRPSEVGFEKMTCCLAT